MQTSSSVSYFLRNVPRGPRPERDDEQARVERASRGDSQATAELLSSNLPFVISAAKEFRGRGLPLDDLIAEGCVGLLKAIRRYRAVNGTRFMTYASFWIRKEMLIAAARQPHTVHVPDYARRHGHAAVRLLRLDTPRYADGALRIADVLRHPDPLSAELIVESEQTQQLRRQVLQLAPRDRVVIAARFGLDGRPAQTLSEIARRLGVSKERVRQIEASALAHLRASIARSSRRLGRRTRCH
jgi:RNA polymerase sigma factor (sigma-70 family)